MPDKYFTGDSTTPVDSEYIPEVNSPATMAEGDSYYSKTEIALQKPLASRRIARRIRQFRPIIMCVALFSVAIIGNLNAQLTGSVAVSTEWTDNAFQLSEQDLSRFEHESPTMDFVKTSDDLNLSTRIELAYPLHYRWWKVTPSVIANLAQNVSNTEKYRRDSTFKLRIDRYYWNASALYTYNPYIYYRNFADNDGTGESEKYSYSRDVYRADIAIKPLKNTTISGTIRLEDYRYNEFFTEADGQAITGGLGFSYRMPISDLDAEYSFRSFTNDNQVDSDDSSYDSNIYKGKLTLPKMRLSDGGKTKWQPSLGLAYEQRYYQGSGSWYGGRADYTYTLSTGFKLLFSPVWNLSLDYSHIYRNVESDNAALLLSKEYSENRLSATMKFKF